jgi:hypothetical protein
MFQFRGSIAEPQHALFTLRREYHYPTTQNSLPGAGQALPGGLGYPLGLDERFPSCFLHPFPLSQAFLTQRPCGSPCHPVDQQKGSSGRVGR